MIRKAAAISIILATVLTGFLYSGVALAQPCEKWVAKAVSVQGAVHALRTGEKQWRPVKLHDTFCSGDMIRIMKLSRANIVLSNDAILRLDQNTTVTFSEPEKEKPFLVNLLNGAAYFFSRLRRTIRVMTPFVNAIVEGTEFYARVGDDKTFVSLFEGRVGLTNGFGSIALAKGQSAVAQANRAPAFQMVVRPRDAVQWTLYYPPVLDLRPSNLQTSGWQTLVRKSVELYEEGRLHQAIENLEEVTEEIRDPLFFAYRASLLLSVGRVERAKLDVEKALHLSPSNSHALALQSVIAVAQNEKQKALNLGRNAVESDPRSGAAWIALSYSQQAHFDLKEALSSVKKAVKSEPQNSLAWARLAEMWLSFGNLKKAFDAADRAVALNPNLSRTQTILGFAYLTQVKTGKSKAAFEKAIELDQADPLPRLGLGLAKIREGGFPKWEAEFGKIVDKGLLEGTKELEIAVSLDPDHSLIRSYLGKAYYEEARDRLAANQLAMAKELDPSDPTPFFYDAIRKQSINRPVEALMDLQESISLNDNRAVYRSRLLLDSDLAARSAGLAQIYNNLGFQRLAQVGGYQSVNTDPANFSAHRILADSLSALPRHQIARVSELLQSQLLQPINIHPVQPHLAESSLFILDGAGPSDASLNEFNLLFNRNRLALQVSGIVGTHRTFGEEIVQSGVWDRFSYSIGQFHYQTDGFRQNNYLKEDIYNVFLQGMLSYQTSLQAELRSTEKRYGDLSLNFFPYDFFPFLRQNDETESIRLGFHHAFSPGSDLIGSFMYQDAKPRLRIYGFLGFANLESKADDDGYGGELQWLFRSECFNFITGSGHFYIKDKETDFFEPLLPPLAPPTVTKTNIRHTNLYLYSQIHYPKNVTFTVGGSGDLYDGATGEENQFNPKFGVTWNPFPSTTLRAAIFRVLKRTLLTDQTIEPTQVAGFNQFFDDADGTKSWRYGAAMDQKFSKSLSGGVEFSGRKLNVPFSLAIGPGPSRVLHVDWKEQLGRAYLYWAPHPWLGLNAEYQYERFDRESEVLFGTHIGVAGIRNVKTHRVPLGINLYHPSGLSAQLKATYVHQDGRFQPQGVGFFIPGNDQFCVVDASISYRFPKRYGLISIGVKNLFNKEFRFQDTDIHMGTVNAALSPTIQPKRLVFGKFTLVF